MVNFEKSYVKFSNNTPSSFIGFIGKPLGVPSKDALEEYLECPMEFDGTHSLVNTRLISWPKE